MFKKFDDNGMMKAVDRCDSGQLELQDILKPAGWVLLSFLMDPRSGLGYFKEYRISNYQLMVDLIQYCRVMAADHILQLPDVAERVKRYFSQEEQYQKMIQENSHTEDNVLIIDLRDVDNIKVGNRFKEYAMFPEQDISLRIFWGRGKEKVVFSCGHSILNRSSQTNVGKLMLKYDGGGHTRVGTCQVEINDMETVRDELIAAMKENAFMV